jgi:phage baseplate assembly protein W
VDQMIRQVLLTTPGERVDLPEFGCGLRQFLFAPNSNALQATTQILVQRSLNQWLGNQISLQSVTVTPGPGGDYSQILVQVAYVLLETQSLQQTQVLVS